MNKVTREFEDGHRDPFAPPAAEAPMFDDLALEVRALWSAIYRNRYVFGVVIFVAIVAGFVVTMFMTPRYKAQTTIQIEQQAAKVLDGDNVDQLSASADEDRFLQTQIEVMQSRAIRQLVVDKLGLARSDAFFVRMKAKPPVTAAGSASAAAARREAAVDILGGGLDVTLPRNSRIVEVGFTSPDPALAAQISDAVGTTFITFNLQRKFDTSAYARGFIESRLADVKRRLEDSERELIDYARKSGLIDASAGAGGGPGMENGPRSLTTANLVQLNAAYALASSQRVTAEQRWRQASASPLMSLPEVLTNQTVQNLQQRLAEAKAVYNQDATRRKADFPSMMQQAALIKELQSQLDTVSSTIRASYRDQYETALKQEQALEARLGQLKQSTLAEQDRTVRYTILKREADTNRTLYDGLLQRYKELSASAGVLSNNISIVDTAVIPSRPVSPKLWLNLLIALLAGAAIAGVIVLIREKLEDVVRLPEDVTRKLRVTFLNSVPLVASSQQPAEALEDVRSPISEAYYALRTSIELASPEGAPRTILFTSSRQAEGKSTSAVAIASNLARSGKRVLLIDSDLRKPSLHRLMDTVRVEGFANVLARHRTIEEVTTKTETPNLDFIGCGPLPPNPAELLSGPTLGIVLNDLRKRYDHVIIDGPPVLGLADAVLLASVTDAVIFIVQFNSSKSSQAKAAIARLRSGGATILGAVLTKFDVRKTGYGDEYGYVYTYGADQGARG